MTVAIIKYNAGNIYSVDYALKRLGIDAIVTDNKEKLQAADKVIFPGVGAAENTMDHLKSTGLDRLIKELKQPVLGICLGMQVMCRFSEEGNVDCLDIFNVDVKRFIPVNGEKIPHMGWNTIDNLKTDLFSGIDPSVYVYFVHGYYVPVCEYTVAKADYVQPFSAAINKDNFYATQFHPEKSGSIGEKILHNFIRL